MLLLGDVSIDTVGLSSWKWAN